MNAIRPERPRSGPRWTRTARCADASSIHLGDDSGFTAVRDGDRRPLLSILHLAGWWYGEPAAGR